MKTRIDSFINIFLIAVLFTFSIGCKNAPSPSSSGQDDINTSDLNSTSEVEAITDGKSVVRIEAFGKNSSHFSITVHNTNGVKTGTYSINNPGTSAFYKDDFKGPDAYLTNALKDNMGNVTITTLTQEKVVGTFEFSIRNAGNPDDKRVVSNGSFNLKFSTY